MDDQFLTVSEAASFLRIAQQTLYRWRHESRIPYRKHGGKLVFYKPDLIEWSKAQERKALPEYGFTPSPGNAITPKSLPKRRAKLFDNQIDRREAIKNQEVCDGS